tara:strand:- start:1842 stop:2978 length:1137 start_codon:yes stop_codon:yes gene_type:complete
MVFGFQDRSSFGEGENRKGSDNKGNQPFAPPSSCCHTRHKLYKEGVTKCLSSRAAECETTIKIWKEVDCGGGCPGDHDWHRCVKHGCGCKPCELEAEETSTKKEVKFKYISTSILCYRSDEPEDRRPHPRDRVDEGDDIIYRTPCPRKGRCKTPHGKVITKVIKHKCCPKLEDLPTLGALERTLWMCDNPIKTNIISGAIGAKLPFPMWLAPGHFGTPGWGGCSSEYREELKLLIRIRKQVDKRKRENSGYTLHSLCMDYLMKTAIPGQGKYKTTGGWSNAKNNPFITNKELLESGNCPCLDDKEMSDPARTCCDNESNAPFQSEGRNIPPSPTRGSKFRGYYKIFPCKALPNKDEWLNWFRNVYDERCPPYRWPPFK